MDRQERAEVAVRAVGLVAVVYAATWLVMQGYWVVLWLGHGSSGAVSSLVVMLLGQVLTGLVGAVLTAWPAPVARLMVPRPSEGEDTALGELLRLGMFFLAFRALLGLLIHAALGLFERPLFLVSAGTDGLLAAVFLGRPRPLTAWLAARTRAREGWSLAGALGMGLALIAFYQLGTRFEMLATLPATLASVSRAPEWSAAQSHALLVQSFVGAGLWLVCWGLLLALCGRLGRWLAQGAPQSLRRVLRALGSGNWIELTFQASVLLVVLVNLLPWGISVLDMSFPGTKWLACVVPLIAVGLLVAAARLGTVLAHALCSRRPEDAADRRSLLIAVEVAMTVIVIDYFAAPWFSAEHGLYTVLPPYLLVTLLLALRGDIARWCVRPVGAEEDARPCRQAALYPWLALLGVVLALGAAQQLIFQGLAWTGLVHDEGPSAGGITIRAMTYVPTTVKLAIGLALLFARRPLAQLLAYGPLLHRRGGIRHGLTSD